MALYFIVVKIGENTIEIQILNNGIITIRALYFLNLKVI